MDGIKSHKQTVFLLLYVFSVAFLLYLFAPYLAVVLLGGILVLALHPINTWVKSYLGAGIGAASMTVLAALLVLIPATFALFGVIEEVASVQTLIQETNLTAVEQSVEELTGVEIALEDYFNRGVSQIQSYVASQLPNVVGGLTLAMINIAILFFTLYYGFKDGESFVNGFFKMLPFSDEHRRRLRDRSYSVFSGVLYGQLFVAVLQGILGGLSFFIFGVSGPIFWGMIMAFLSFIPLLGTPIIWLPTSIFLFLSGDIFSAVGIFVFNAVITSNIDTVLKPKLIGDRTQMHPLLVVLSIFGGLSLFGVVGFVLGPVLVSASYLIIQFYLEDVGKGVELL